MADESLRSRHVAFAERFAAGPVNRFNAFAALDRARLLLRETQQIKEIFEREEEQEEPAPWSWHGLEVVPYTLVGLATCLEWHARSRLTDLYSFKPDAIGPKTLEGKVPPRVLSQMIHAKVSIPQLLGASITVGSVDEYLTVFDNLFEMLEIKSKPNNLIQPAIVEQIGLFGDPIREPLVREKLDQLFTIRHALVHEIGHDSGNERTLCEMWDASHIVWMCHTVISTIVALERALTEHAPQDFPNLLTKQGYPVDIRDQLVQSIEDLERKISTEIALRPADAQGEWAHALDLARRSADFHEKLFSNRQLFQERNWSRTNILLRTALEQRLALLIEIAAALARSGSARL
jgi:hypothetical protein